MATSGEILLHLLPVIRLQVTMADGIALRREYDAVAENVGSFVSVLERGLEREGFGMPFYQVQAKSLFHPRRPFSRLPCVLLSIVACPQETPERSIFLSMQLYRDLNGTRGNPESFIRVIPRMHLPSEEAPPGVSEAQEASIMRLMRAWWNSVWYACYDRRREKAAQVARFKEELAAASWRSERVANWVAAGMALEDM